MSCFASQFQTPAEAYPAGCLEVDAISTFQSALPISTNQHLPISTLSSSAMVSASRASGRALPGLRERP